MPPAAYAAEPVLPEADGWPFSEAFPRTSGTGRYKKGAFLWTDFLYDDTGALGLVVDSQNPRGTLHPAGGPVGTYRYEPGDAMGNGADVFRAGIGIDAGATYWRVDWTTLVDMDVPVAAFAIATDPTSTTPMPLPHNIGLDANGVDAVLLLSGAGAWLTDVSTGASTPVGGGGNYKIDLEARSFVLRLPLATFPASGRWRVHLVAGVATPGGDGFRDVTLARGALPGGPNVYNVSFRTREQELAGPGRNSWMESYQASVLASGDVSSIGQVLDWAALTSGHSTPEPTPKGFSNRWYVSNVEFGQGLVPIPNGNDHEVVGFLGRVQPYAVYVPASYDDSIPAPMTWTLHASGMSHNQFFAYSPKFPPAGLREQGRDLRGADGP